MYDKADWDGLRAAMIDFFNSLEGRAGQHDVEELWIEFKTALLEARDIFVPSKLTRGKTGKPWVSPELKKLLRRKDRLYKKKKKSNRDDLKAEFRELKREVQRRLRRAYYEYVSSILTEDDLEHAPTRKRFWTFIKNKRSDHRLESPPSRWTAALSQSQKPKPKR